MKQITKTLLAAVAAVGLVASASAQPISHTFDTDAQGWQNMTWTAGPAGWSGGAAIQAPATVGGWTLGGSFNYYHEFSYANNNEQVKMQAIAATGLGHVSFDIIMDGTSFPNNVGTWYQLNVAGNSAGANGWTQVGLAAPGWRDAGDTSLVSLHYDLTFAQLGWADAEDNTGWFQLYVGANSDADKPVDFYLDNVYVIPEPSVLALAGLGAAALLIRRRK
jgi:PEP-CTERM motif